MKASNSDKSSVLEIDHLVSSISGNEKNKISGIFIDESLLEFYALKDEISIPPIAVSELDYTAGAGITGNLVSVIPEYLYNHTLLEKRKPSSEQHSLQFVKLITGKLVDFVHIFRFDFKLTGGYGTIAGKGDNRTFPGYQTNRIRYKSRLVPVIKGSDPLLIDSLRLKSQLEVDTDGKRFTSVFFDEYSTTEISIDFSVKSGNDIYSIPAKIYQFIPYDYFTACMNIPDPTAAKLDSGAELFEPLFFYLYFQYRERHHEIEEKQLSVWGDYLELTESGVMQKPLLQERLREFFSRYTLYRDDDMMLKGLRQIAVKE
jgi:hypothetical protein